ncbi:MULTISPECIES: hypothetical protein [Metabacillus]|uniref:Uncharacterized protein n=1 Tax=Metabacillus hrfriensis TaxID=3048891 RepID=A0ACD4RB54_9BACI|nr:MULTISPECIES: hypothetical protein [Metabacillus]UOK57966.1 hypothetical protein MGI18_27545 [Bacillus sp. OVS6]USK28506.1 hypothetical protein LIT32_24275 [Bacillus sp. CMF21]UAL52187.1 hypothetical protein K8L98_24070 [Metabacillus dongyingensis]UOK57976.1 hypothetical protein MGI18_00105 [Bacillus sp. OVS6]WHZ57720.1 hypothetical protein QLQ22_24295 [Metabacillus sp. CT-WN-B3]
MKKVLLIIGSLMILSGVSGALNHISLIFKSLEEELGEYGSPASLMIWQYIPSFSVYVTLLAAGSLLLGLAALLKQQEKRNVLMEQLIDAVKGKDGEAEHAAAVNPSDIEKQTLTLFQSRNERDLEETSEDQEKDERYYWKG